MAGFLIIIVIVAVLCGVGMIITENDKKKEKNDVKKELKNNTNTIVSIIKGLAGVTVVLGIIGGIFCLENEPYVGIAIIIASIVSAVFVYALGEIIQKLQNIEDNTRK